MEDNQQLHLRSDSRHGSTAALVVGFVLCLLFTAAAYLTVISPGFDRGESLIMLVTFGVAQLLTQLFFFLHIGTRSQPRTNLIAFVFTLFILVLLVGGSLWIMQNLKHNMAPSSAMEAYMLDNQ